MSLEKAIGKEIDRLLSCIISSGTALKKKCNKEYRDHMNTVIDILKDEVIYWKGMRDEFKKKGYEHPIGVVINAKKKLNDEMKKKISSKRTIVISAFAILGIFVFFFVYSYMAIFYTIYLVFYALATAIASIRKTWHESLIHSYEMERRTPTSSLS